MLFLDFDILDTICSSKKKLNEVMTLSHDATSSANLLTNNFYYVIVVVI